MTDDKSNKVYRVWDMDSKCYWEKIWKKRGHAQAAIRCQFDAYEHRQIPWDVRVRHLIVEEYEMIKVADIPAPELFRGR